MADDDEVLDDTLEPEITDEEENGSDEGIEDGREVPGGEGDEPLREEGDDEEGQEGQVSLKKGRGNAHFRRLRAENQALKEQQATIRRELDEVRMAQHQRFVQPDPAQERARYEALSDFEKLQYEFNRGRQEDYNDRRMLEVQLWDSTDKSQFSSLCATNPRAAKRADRVEQDFQKRLRAGNGVDRATILRWMIGDDILRSKAVAKRAADGKRNIARQRTNPMSGRGDVGGERRGGKTAADRLEGVVF